MEQSGQILEQLFHAAVAAANPYRSVMRHGDEIRTLFGTGRFSRLLAIGFGKASPAMAAALEDSLGDLVEAGVVVTKYGHGVSLAGRKIELFEAGHPIPDANGCRAADRIMELAARADERTLVVTLISGGGSALLASPAEGISLAEKQEMTDLLLRTGADILELNTVRKHLSRVKGGRLAELIHPAPTVSLILSDVIGDRLDIIASGPTAPDPTTFDQALAVLDRHKLLEKSPRPVVERLLRGRDGLIGETPKPGNPVFRRVTNRIIGGNRMALDEAREKAAEQGLKSEILSAELRGEAREAGKWLARRALETRADAAVKVPCCLVSGGETTVTVMGDGKGGRNMELALAFALEIAGEPGITLLSAGTDGTDGPTDAAGAVVDGTTVARARATGLEPEAFLDNNDSYNFFKKAGGLLVTGGTGTNVMDMQLMLIEPD